jgi:hypothetical protein
VARLDRTMISVMERALADVLYAAGFTVILRPGIENTDPGKGRDPEVIVAAGPDFKAWTVLPACRRGLLPAGRRAVPARRRARQRPTASLYRDRVDGATARFAGRVVRSGREARAILADAGRTQPRIRDPSSTTSPEDLISTREQRDQAKADSDRLRSVGVLADHRRHGAARQ